MQCTTVDRERKTAHLSQEIAKFILHTLEKFQRYFSLFKKLFPFSDVFSSLAISNNIFRGSYEEYCKILNNKISHFV